MAAMSIGVPEPAAEVLEEVKTNPLYANPTQPNFLCPPSLAHSASFCPAWGIQATAWTDARLKSCYPWDPAILHQFTFQQWGCSYTGHILHKLLVCHQSKPVISHLLAFHRYSTWSMTLSLAFQTDVTRDVKSVSVALTRMVVICLPMKTVLCSSGPPLSELSFSTNAWYQLSLQGHVTWSDLPAEISPRPWSPGAGVCSVVGFAVVANTNREHAAGNILILYH